MLESLKTHRFLFEELVKRDFTKNQRRMLLVIYTIFLLVDLAVNITVARFGVLTFAFYKQSLIIFSVLMTIVNILVIKKRLREHLFTCGLTAVFILACFTVVSYIEILIISKRSDETHIIINIISHNSNLRNSKKFLIFLI